MKKAKIINIFSLLFNVAILACFAVGMVKLYSTTHIGAESLKYYTNLTAIVTALASLLMILPNIIGIFQRRNATPRLFYTLRFISAVMSLITFVVVLTVLIPEYGVDVVLLNEKDGTMYFHLILPILTVLSFIFLDIMPTAKFRKTFEPFIATLIYSAVLLVMVIVVHSTKGAQVAKEFAPYRFMWIFRDMDPERFVVNIVTCIVLLLGSYVVSIVVWGLNRIVSYIVIGVSYGDGKVASSEDREIKSNKRLKVSERIRKYIRQSVSLKGENNETSDKVYHISYSNRRKRTWKVKGEGAQRANKIFTTQKEAIDWANELVKKNGGSIRVHSMVGRIRKE